MDDRTQIELEAKRRGITRLCHFTQSRKLSHILTDLDGIWSTEQLRERSPDLLDQTDPVRLDRHENHICCSIEYPNTWYLAKVQDRDPLFRDWVILFLNPSLLWQEQTLFCPRNAATGHGELVQEGYESFKQLYAPQVVGAWGKTYRRRPAMPNCCPTDDQAEVLVFEHIPKSDILGVVVPTAKRAEIEMTRLSFVPNVTETSWHVAPELFDRRWSNLIRRGQRPTEDLYQGSEL